MVGRGQMRPSRPLDAYYDQTYTVSHQRDLYRGLQRDNPPSVRLVPNDRNMFSASQSHPSHVLRVKDSALAPPEDVRGGAAPRAGGATSDVVGPQRWKYFRRPMVAPMKSMAADAVLSRPAADYSPVVDVDANAHSSMQEVSLPTHMSASRTAEAGTQSDFRDSEAQTDPYTPAYIIPEGTDPELIALESLSWQNGLPAGPEEIQMIERTRRRKNVESNVPSLEDPNGFEKRLVMMQELELTEWKEREDHIKELQEKRLHLLTAALKKREIEKEAATIERLDANKSDRLDMLEDDLIRHRDDRVKNLRKLSKRSHKTVSRVNARTVMGRNGPLMASSTVNKAVHGETKSRDVIGEYANFASRQYAPVARDGRHPDRNSYRFDARPGLLENLNGLLYLEQTLPANLTMSKSRRTPGTGTASSSSRRQRQWQDTLADASSRIARTKTSKDDVEALKLSELYTTTPRVVRPSTPTIEYTQDDHEEEAVLLLQRLIRGRAIQNELYAGKQKLLRYINEVRSISEVKDVEQKTSAQTAVDQKQKLLLSAVDHAERIVEGDHVGRVVDYFAKELVRQREEARVSRMIHKAEDIRRRREATESGARQEESELRQREQAKYMSVMGSVRATAESVLGECFVEAVSLESVREALLEAELKSSEVDDIIDALEERLSSSETTVRDLVTSFLIPDVRRRELRDDVRMDQKALLLAAHQEIYNGVRGELS